MTTAVKPNFVHIQQVSILVTSIFYALEYFRSSFFNFSTQIISTLASVQSTEIITAGFDTKDKINLE